MNNTEEKRMTLKSLQAVRALAFLGIFSSHSGITQLGAWGVSVFLVLSGFVLMYAYSNKHLTVSWKENVKFSIKKIIRLYPLHFLMLLFIICFGKMYLGYEVSFSRSFITKIIFNVFLLQAWIPHSDIYFSMNGVAWYLSVCLFIYMIFPFIMRKINNYTGIGQAYINIAVCFMIQVLIAFFSNYIEIPLNDLNDFSKWVTYVFPVFRLGDFFIGCNLGYIFIKHKQYIGKLQATMGEIVVLLLVCMAQKIYVGQIGVLGTEWCRYTLLFIPTSICLVYLFAINKGIISRILTNDIFIFIGDISAYAFLIHQIVIKCTRTAMANCEAYKLKEYIIGCVALAITIMLSRIYQSIESIFVKRM